MTWNASGNGRGKLKWGCTISLGRLQYIRRGTAGTTERRRRRIRRRRRRIVTYIHCYLLMMGN
jgi:hypothetical protein